MTTEAPSSVMRPAADGFGHDGRKAVCERTALRNAGGCEDG
jgi:hypothetical protein